MAITYKTPDDIARLRISGRLAADVLAMIGEHVKAGASTDDLDAICNDYIVNTLKAVPNYPPAVKLLAEVKATAATQPATASTTAPAKP